MVASNLFGDILSDLGPACTGTIGIAPSGNINPENKYPSLFEPVHGSAPDIAGKLVANPLAMILSVSMMFKYSFDDDNLSNVIIKNVNKILNDGYRTQDIFSEGCKLLNTSEVGDILIEELKNEKI